MTDLIHYYYHKERCIFDPDNKIVMIFTPRAACTLSCNVFFEHMGLRESFDKDVWIHKYRQSYRPWADDNIFVSPEFTKIKFIRNPYKRAVSSYLYAMIDYPQERKFSFYDFMKSLVPGAFCSDILYHCLSQYSPVYEKFTNHYVRVENIREDLLSIDEKHNTKFLEAYNKINLEEHNVSHKDKKNKEITEFIGMTSYNDLLKRFDNPHAEYKYYYNDEVRKLIEEVYANDINHYGYKFDLN